MELFYGFVGLVLVINSYYLRQYLII